MKSAHYDQFRRQIMGYYQTRGRHDLPWRLPDKKGFNGYKILVSELMLQQTQVGRVIPKYNAFLERFPTLTALATSPLGDVLVAWQGLGYNRRAKFLWQAAQYIVAQYNEFPRTIDTLIKLPGVGPNTAGAILAYTFNQPVTFIETNIRSVFIHHFLQDQINITDSVILNLVEKTLDRTNPRIWYWALMDYGTFLKQTVGNTAKASKAYSKQSKFIGSDRQIRGHILRVLAAAKTPIAKQELSELLRDQRVPKILEELTREGLIQTQGNMYVLP